MATITVTEAARAVLREGLVRYPLDSHTTVPRVAKRPVLSVFWNPVASTDGWRSPEGEAVWVTIAVGWTAGVIDWEQMGEKFKSQTSLSPTSWGEFELALSSEVEKFSGQLIIDWSDGGLHVEAIPI